MEHGDCFRRAPYFFVVHRAYRNNADWKYLRRSATANIFRGQAYNYIAS
jgi:hypothetical protein